MSINFGGSLGQGEVILQAGSKKPSSGQADAIFANFSAFMTSIVDKNSGSASSSDVLSVRLGTFGDNSLDKPSAQEFLSQLIGNDFVQVDDQVEKLISEKGFEGFLKHIEDVGELENSIHFNPTAAFVDSRMGIIKPNDIVDKNLASLTISTLAELDTAINFFKNSMRNITLEENLPELGSLETKNLTFINDLIGSVPVELELNSDDTSAVFFDIRDLKINLSGKGFSHSTKSSSDDFPETFLIPQIVPVKVKNVNIDEKDYEPFVAVKVELLGLEDDLGLTDLIDLPDGLDGTPGARLFGVTKTVEIHPDMDVKSKLLIGLSIPQNSDLENLPDFVKLNISLGYENREIFNPGASPQPENSYSKLSPLSKTPGSEAFSPITVETLAGASAALAGVSTGDVVAGPAGALAGVSTGDVVAGPAGALAAVSTGAIVGGSAGNIAVDPGSKLTADLDDVASEFLVKLKEMSGGSQHGTKIITKTIPTNGLTTNFEMQQVTLPEKNTFILNQKNEEISFFGSKEKPIDLVQNRIVFDNEIKIASSMRNETRADFITSVVALETHLKSFHKLKSDKLNFFAKDFETNVLESKTVPGEQKTVSNPFNPKSILETSEALRMKSVSSQHLVVKDDFLKIGQANITNPAPFKTGNQFVNSTTSSSTLGSFASSVNSKILLYDAQYASRISMLVVDKVLKGKENFEIHLEPKSFGKIKVNVLMNKQALDIRMVAETQAAASLLRGSEDTLNQLTNQNGMKLASFSVGMQSGSDQQRQNSNQTRNRAAGKSNSMLEHTKTQNLQTATSGSTSTGLNLIA
jgi:flagellar hook-length control protein FliK